MENIDWRIKLADWTIFMDDMSYLTNTKCYQVWAWIKFECPVYWELIFFYTCTTTRLLLLSSHTNVKLVRGNRGCQYWYVETFNFLRTIDTLQISLLIFNIRPQLHLTSWLMPPTYGYSISFIAICVNLMNQWAWPKTPST